MKGAGFPAQDRNLSSRKHPDWLWWRPCPLFNGNHVPFPRDKVMWSLLLASNWYQGLEWQELYLHFPYIPLPLLHTLNFQIILMIGWSCIVVEPWLISNLMHKIIIYLHIIHLLKSSTCFEHCPAHLQEVYVVIKYMQPVVSSPSVESDDTTGCIYTITT